jgi:hypothetical protein
MYKPITFTDEELEEFSKAAAVASGVPGFYINSSYSWTDEYGWGNWKEEPPAVPKCDHDWKKESFFSNNVYETCTKCDEKKEDT